MLVVRENVHLLLILVVSEIVPDAWKNVLPGSVKNASPFSLEFDAALPCPFFMSRRVARTPLNPVASRYPGRKFLM